MRYIFVDAPGVSLSRIEEIEPNESDKVLVFSQCQMVKEVCERKGFFFMSDYPSSKEQSDFYIIASLIKTIIPLTDEQKVNFKFVLISNCRVIRTAFFFQLCNHLYNQQDLSEYEELKLWMLNEFGTATSVWYLHNRKGISRKAIKRVMKELISENKIKRSRNNEMEWVQTGYY